MPTEDLSYFQEEEFKKSLARYEEMLQGGQPVYLEADELTDIAEYYMVKNKMKQAMACIDYALSIHPDSVDPLIFLARQKMFDGDWSEAIRIRNKVSDPKDREVMFFDAEMLLRQGNVEKAERLMEMLAEREKRTTRLMWPTTWPACSWITATWNRRSNGGKRLSGWSRTMKSSSSSRPTSSSPKTARKRPSRCSTTCWTMRPTTWGPGIRWARLIWPTRISEGLGSRRLRAGHR